MSSLHPNPRRSAVRMWPSKPYSVNMECFAASFLLQPHLATVKNDFDVKRKKYIYKNSNTECGKRCQNIYFIGLKKTCLGVLDRGNRDKNNATGLKRRRRYRNVNLQCFPYTRLHALLRFCIYLPTNGARRERILCDPQLDIAT